MCVISKRLVHHDKQPVAAQVILGQKWRTEPGPCHHGTILFRCCLLVFLDSWLEKQLFSLAWCPSVGQLRSLSISEPVNFLSGEWLCDAFARGSFFQEKHRSLRSWGGSSCMLSYMEISYNGGTVPHFIIQRFFQQATIFFYYESQPIG